MAIYDIRTKEQEYVGLVLSIYEENYYDDSWFYARVWDEETQSVKAVCFDSTCAGQTQSAVVDATDEVKAKAEAWQRQRERNSKAEFLKRFRKTLWDVANKASVSFSGLKRLYNAVSYRHSNRKADAIIALVGATRTRNSFRKQLRQQCIDWVNTKSPKYQTPLSFKQMQYV